MSEPENFISRWSRRKREAAEDGEQVKPAAAPQPPSDNAQTRADKETAKPTPSPSTDAAASTAPAFDLTRLPSLDSITAGTDIRAFLTPGVPPDLARAALRRAWAADPSIRDFKGLADYDWDFVTPGAIPGFGPLPMTDELRRMVTEMVGRSLSSEPPEPAKAAEAEVLPADSASKIATASGDQPQQRQVAAQAPQDVPANIPNEPAAPEAIAAPQQEYFAVQQSSPQHQNQQIIAHRPHGRALPK